MHFVCVCVCVCVSICLYVGMHYKMKSCRKRNYFKIISNISAYISPVRLRNIPGDLAGEIAHGGGWGKPLDSKYNFLIISHFNLKNCTYQNDCFKGNETHGLQKFMWSMWVPSICNTTCRLSKAIWLCYINQQTGVKYIYIYIYIYTCV